MHAMIALHVEITALAYLSADPFLARESNVIGQCSSLRLPHQPIVPRSGSLVLSLIHISEPTRPSHISRMPSSA